MDTETSNYQSFCDIDRTISTILQRKCSSALFPFSVSGIIETYVICCNLILIQNVYNCLFYKPRITEGYGDYDCMNRFTLSDVISSWMSYGGI